MPSGNPLSLGFWAPSHPEPPTFCLTFQQVGTDTTPAFKLLGPAHLPWPEVNPAPSGPQFPLSNLIAMAKVTPQLSSLRQWGSLVKSASINNGCPRPTAGALALVALQLNPGQLGFHSSKFMGRGPWTMAPQAE